MIGAETTRIPPLFLAAKAGRSVPIDLPTDRVEEDGIAVDLVDPQTAVSYTRWVVEQLKGLGWSDQTAATEVVTGTSMPFSARLSRPPPPGWRRGPPKPKSRTGRCGRRPGGP